MCVIDLRFIHPVTNHLVDPTFLGQAEAAIKDELKTVTQLSEFASKYPYYK